MHDSQRWMVKRKATRRHLWQALLAATCLSLPAAGACQEGAPRSATADNAELRASRALLERILKENIVPFWLPQTLDRENGGYSLNHDQDGEWRGPAPKFLVTQARQVWFFSRLARSPYGKPEHLAAARHGFAFLRDHMWDPEHGGFFWEVNAEGTAPTQPHKHLYGQAFALYALSEYALASQDAGVTELARRLFGLLERHARDARYGGYREFFSRAWGEAPSAVPPYMGVDGDVKLMNTHLHLMEALSAYYRLTKEPAARERLRELVMIETSTVVRKSVAACTDEYRADWTPGRADRVSYGHDVENVWLVMDAMDALGLPQAPFGDLYRALVDNALTHGFDKERGGFYAMGPLGQPADLKVKVWWAEAEGLVSTLSLYRMTGDARYRDAYVQTLGWIEKNQVDWQHGDWHDTIMENGHVRGLKAHAWKGAYHNGRAMLRCLEILDEMGVR